MGLHVIPDDGAPHAPTTECGCDPRLGLVTYAGTRREAFIHPDQRIPEDRRLPGDGHDDVDGRE